MEKNYKDAIYENYITLGFSKAHDPEDIKKDYNIHGRIFRKNYLSCS